MKQFLRLLLNWLERKFPDKVEITLQEYNKLYEELGQLNKYVQTIVPLDAKINALQKDLDLVKSNLGYLGTRNQIKPLER